MLTKQAVNKKFLVLMRHGKAGWDDADLSDFARPLTAQGRHDVKLTAVHFLDSLGSTCFVQDQTLHDTGASIDSQKGNDVNWLMSSAKRTLDTALLLQKVIQHTFPAVEQKNVNTDVNEKYYLAEADTWLQELQKLPESSNTAIVVGHNPGISALASQLVQRHVDMPTSTIVVLELGDMEWSRLLSSSDAAMEKAGYKFHKFVPNDSHHS